MIVAIAIFCLLLGAFIGGLLSWSDRNKVIDHWVDHYNWTLAFKQAQDVELAAKRELVAHQTKHISELRQKIQEIGLWLNESSNEVMNEGRCA